MSTPVDTSGCSGEGLRFIIVLLECVAFRHISSSVGLPSKGFSAAVSSSIRWWYSRKSMKKNIHSQNYRNSLELKNCKNNYAGQKVTTAQKRSAGWKQNARPDTFPLSLLNPYTYSYTLNVKYTCIQGYPYIPTLPQVYYTIIHYITYHAWHSCSSSN